MDQDQNKEAADLEHDEAVATNDRIGQMGHLAAQEDHQISKWQSLKQDRWAVAWCLFAVWTTILVSFENQATSSVIGIPEFRKDFGHYLPSDGSYVLPATWQSAFSGGPQASSAVGALIAGQLADWLGRKRTLMLSLLVSYAAITMEFVSTTNELFFGGKFLNGFAVGTMASLCTTYLGEISPHALRGVLTCTIALAYIIGPFVVALIVNYTGTVSSRWAYRSIFLSQYGFAAISTIFVPFMPESPWWLVNTGNEEKALRSLIRLGYKDGRETKRLALIKLTLEEIRRETDGVTYLECFRRSNLRRTIVSVAPYCILALCGVVFIAGYTTYYAQLAGYSTAMSFKLFIALQTASVFGNICSWFLVDRFGRRTLALWGTGLLAVLLMVTGGLATVRNPNYIRGAISLMVLYGWLYNITIGAVAFNLLTEVATSRLRAKTIAIGIFLQNALFMMWSFVIPYLFNPDHANLGAKISFIFGGLSVLSFIYLYLYQVETANRSYEELDELFMKRVPARKFNKHYLTDAETRGREALRKFSVSTTC